MNTKIGKRIKIERIKRDLTQEQLAFEANLNRTTISSIETGQYEPTAKLALLLCVALDKKFEELFYF